MKDKKKKKPKNEHSYLTGKFRKKPYRPAVCQRCLGPMPIGYPGALSRRDSKTEICSDCGTAEAFEDFHARPKKAVAK